jgi:DNA-binding MarR family transcriptional regulator
MEVPPEADLAGAALDQAANDLACIMQSLELAAWAPIVSWAEESGLSLEHVRLLLALDSQPLAAATALDLAEVTGLSLDAIYRLLPCLCAGGYVCEDFDVYSLTESGDLALDAIDGARRAGIRTCMSGLDSAQRLLLEFFLRA